MRAHHPDVGGDPEVFRRGLEAFRAGPDPRTALEPARAAPVEVHRRRGGPGVLLDWFAGARRRRRRPPRVS